ncbi:hypothetical protein [Silvimonas soli]|uniref:hypothetical protein n=1 Tax=Silvimonas soli TaxID=2980100 RepID=UPI0024B3C3B5|nr:hypothetical protein [Silvimonas soli]
MQKRVIKFQAALFGTFNFPAEPDTIVKLMTVFAPLGFMPQVISVPDLMTGLTAQRIGMTRGDDVVMLLAPDRIDFTATMPTVDIAGFVNDAVTNVEQLERGNLRFNRVALVVDTLLEEMSEAEIEAMREKLLPHSGARSIEWMARWVTPVINETEQYNVCLEAIKASGLMMFFNGRMQPLHGIKTLHDVSTTPSNTSPRFDAQNLRGALDAISQIISARTDLDNA